MFRIRRIYDNHLAANKDAIAQVQEILKVQFFALNPEEIEKLPLQLQNPLKYRFKSVLFVAEGSKRIVKGFAFLLHATDLNFSYLEFLSTAHQKMGRGIGGILYERIREECRSFGSFGLFFECLPDDPALCRNPAVLKMNAARLRFYERYGTRPITNTAYETPIKTGGDLPPYLVYDNLGQTVPLSREKAQAVARAVLERKYSDVCPKDYIENVIASFKDDPVLIRPPKYIKGGLAEMVSGKPPSDQRILLVINDRHEIHHVHDQGYVEAPVRVRSILKEILPTGMFEEIKPGHFSEKCIEAVHDGGFISYLRKVCTNVPPNKSIYPYVFPIRNTARPPKELPIRAGYYCIDTFTPLNSNAFVAAKRAVDCAMTAALEIAGGHRLAYALVRPPGHHAERRAFGGFCYFNSAAAAAHFLSSHGRVAVLDIDYHHGNGTQTIFYSRSDVLTISLHGHPRFAYPYFTGFADETGEGEGAGFNLNIPLPEKLDGQQYRESLAKALRAVRRFRANFLVVALGLDTAKGDPTGSWDLISKDFELNGQMIGELDLPVLVVQEGGYRVRSLGINARYFFKGLWSSTFRSAAVQHKKKVI